MRVAIITAQPSTETADDPIATAILHGAPDAELVRIELPPRTNGDQLAERIVEAAKHGVSVIACLAGTSSLMSAMKLMIACEEAWNLGAIVVAQALTEDRFRGTQRLLPGAAKHAVGVLPTRLPPGVHWWVDPDHHGNDPIYAKVKGCFMAAGSEDARSAPMVAIAHLAGKLATAPTGSPDARIAWLKQVAAPVGSTRSVDPDATPDHLLPLSAPMPEPLPFTRLSAQELDHTAWPALRWSVRLVQPLLTRGPKATARALRVRRQEAYVGNPGRWFEEGPDFVARLNHPLADEVAELLTALANGLIGGDPRALSTFAVQARRLTSDPFEATLQTWDANLGPRIRDHVTHSAPAAALWLWDAHARLPADLQSPSAAEALERAMQTGEIPPVPIVAECPPRLAHLHAFWDLLHFAQGTPEFNTMATVVGNHMATQVPADRITGARPKYVDLNEVIYGSGQAPEALKHVPIELLRSLDCYGPEIEQDWHTLDPMVNGWARDIVGAAAAQLDTPDVNRVLQTFDAGLSNAMMARWPSMSTPMEPVAPGWSRAEVALREHLDTEVGATAWLAMNLLVDGALFGDDSTRWLDQLATLHAHLVPDSEARTQLYALER